MSYTNLNLTPNSPEFKEKYRSVIAAVAKLETHGEIEVGFTHQAGMNTWRRKFYEYQRITGKTYRAEAGEGYTLILRPRHRLARGDHGLIDIKPHRPGSLPKEVPADELPGQEGVVVSEADLELARRILKKVQKEAKEEGETDPIEILKGGSHGSGRSESRGDESDT